MSVSIHISVNPKLSLRDPQETKLGRAILRESILLIDEIGLEQFTFRKLAQRIGSTEATCYRYFENKHKLLLYLLCWYWEWLRFMIEFNTGNLSDPREKLIVAIRTVADVRQLRTPAAYIDPDAMYRIARTEGTKAYHIKAVDDENKEGFFLTYKELNQTLADLIADYDPKFPYPRALAINFLEMVNHHLFFAEHLPTLTDIPAGENQTEAVITLMERFTLGVLKQ